MKEQDLSNCYVYVDRGNEDEFSNPHDMLSKLTLYLINDEGEAGDFVSKV